MMEGAAVYFTADEFLLCCAAAGIESLYGFSGGPLTRRGAAQALFSLVKRGLFRWEEDGFVLCREQADCFRLLRTSETVVLAYQRGDGRRRPCQLLYGGGESFISLAPGERGEDYVGMAQYWDEAEWLRDAGLAPEGNLPDDLTAMMDQESSPACRRLTRFAAGGPAPDQLPEDVFGYLESRRLADWRLRARVCLVRQTLCDHLVAGADGKAIDEIYRLDRLAGFTRDMRMGRTML